MNIEPYKKVGLIDFNDNLKTLTEKLKDYEIKISERKFMGKSKTTVFIESLDLIIILKENGKSIDTIESFKHSLLYDNIDLLKNDFKFLINKFESYDIELIKESDGFRSDKLGIGIYWDGELDKNPKSVIVYSKGHYDKDIDPNDIINYYLNKKK
ncbi:hypothetical protein [uncultured Tenacibaculum sp.]|uniref:hypothetical protein n=1 Tax=uncultured Tenacibaculum sp. TaxID=174713 RepID=UPI002638DB99|nr:hypothetical protein [uncultured Tenacibaculum sp.]